MVTRTWMYDAIIYIYALSLLFSFSDVVGTNRNAKRMGTGLLAFVWVLQTFFFVYRMYEQRYTPVLTMFETLFFYSWLLVTISLALSWFLRNDLLVFLVNIAGFAILALNFFSDPAVSPISKRWEAEDELLFIHITLAIASYVAFLLSAIFSGMYLFLHRRLKERQWSKLMTRFPSLENIEDYMFRTVMIGTPFLILSLALGLVKISMEGNILLVFDPKVLGSLLILMAYAFYLVQRLSARQPVTKLAIWNLAAFALVVLNFLLSNLYSRFHQWVWM